MEVSTHIKQVDQFLGSRSPAANTLITLNFQKSLEARSFFIRRMMGKRRNLVSSFKALF